MGNGRLIRASKSLAWRLTLRIRKHTRVPFCSACTARLKIKADRWSVSVARYLSPSYQLKYVTRSLQTISFAFAVSVSFFSLFPRFYSTCRSHRRHLPLLFVFVYPKVNALDCFLLVRVKFVDTLKQSAVLNSMFFVSLSLLFSIVRSVSLGWHNFRQLTHLASRLVTHAVTFVNLKRVS